MLKKVKKVSKKKEQTDSIKFKKNKDESEPSWYHYIFSIGIILGIIFMIYLGFLGYEKFYKNLKDDEEFENRQYHYHKVGNVEYKIEFFTTFEKIVELNYDIKDIDDLILLNTVTFKIVFPKTNDTAGEGYQLGKTSTRVIGFLNRVYFFNINETNLYKENELSCENSTNLHKVITFDINSSKNQITHNLENGCIEFKAKNVYDMIRLGDAFLYKLITTKERF